MFDYGDRKHWYLSIGRLNIQRWCSTGLATCNRSRHWITVGLWRPSGEARNR